MRFTRLAAMDFNRAAFYCFFAVIATLSFSISLFEITSWVFIGLCLVSMTRERRFKVFKNIFFALAMIYLSMNLLSLFNSGYLLTSARGVSKVLKNILVCGFSFYIVDSKERLRKVFQSVLITAFFISADALIQGLTGFEPLRFRPMTSYLGTLKRLTGPFGHANDFGAYLSFAAVFYFGAVFTFRGSFSKKFRCVLILGFLLSALCLAGTYSRGAWLGVAGALVFLAVLNKSRALFLLILAGLLWGVFLAPAPLRVRAVSLFDVKNGTILERKELWQTSLRMIRQSPVLGLGVNTYARNEPLFKDKELKLDDQYAHNGYLQMAAEIGLAGLASFLALIVYFYARTLRVFFRCRDDFLKRAGFTLLGGVLAFLIHSATDTNLQSILLVNSLWMVMGIGLAAAELAAI